MPERVRQQVEQHALDLLGCAAARRGRLDPLLEAHALRASLGLEAAQARLDERRELDDLQLVARARRRRCARARRGPRRACRAAAPAPAAVRGTRSVASPSSIASSIAVIEAIGVRRSWLAAATSSRRASKRLSRFAAISLNERPSSRELARAVLGRARCEVARCELRRGGAQPLDAPRDRAAEDERCATAAERGCRGDREDLHVVAHVEHHPARRSTATERQQRRRAARAPPSCSRTVGSSRSPNARERGRPRACMPATTSAKPITARTGSRRPRPSRGARALRVALDLRAQPLHVHRHRPGVERGLVAPDAVHQLVAREHLPRMRREEEEEVELLRGQAQRLAVDRDLARRARRSSESPERRAARSARRACAVRRSTVRTRTASSRGENGFVT